jgi:hypothetical protein
MHRSSLPSSFRARRVAGVSCVTAAALLSLQAVALADPLPSTTALRFTQQNHSTSLFVTDYLIKT